MPLPYTMLLQGHPPLPPIPPEGPVIFQTGGPPLPPEALVLIVIAVCVTIAAIAIGVPLARAWARRQDQRAIQPAGSGEVLTRLDRIEHAVEAMSIEVERIAEGQRFANKMFAERAREPLPLKAPGGS